VSEQNQFLSDVSGLSTIKDWVRWCYSRFNENPKIVYGHGNGNSWDETFNIVFEALSLPWDYDIANVNGTLTTSECQYLAHLIRQRIIDRIPTAYLLQRAWFCDMAFFVDARVLIPRSPIAELIKKDFEDVFNDKKISRVLDMCCGSGCIGIACAKALPEAFVDLVDVSQDCLDVANINVDQHQMWDRVKTIQSSLFDELKDASPLSSYDLIVCNPPYLSFEDMIALPPEYKHEPRLGLEAGEDGLDVVKKILAEVSDFISANGLLIMEVGYSSNTLRKTFPDVPFRWIPLENGGDGVFVLTAEQCELYRKDFGNAYNALNNSDAE